MRSVADILRSRFKYSIVFVLSGILTWIVLFPQAAITFGAPDLTVSRIDVGSVSSDCQSLEITGMVSVTINNVGTSPAESNFTVLFFEDANGNRIYDSGLDVVLGSADIEMLNTGESAEVGADISGIVAFSGNLIYAFVDSTDIIPESDETNNYYNTGLNCAFQPTPGSFDPAIEWSWTNTEVLPDYLNVMMTPGVIDLNDDGIPDVVFGATASRTGELFQAGVLRALNGNNGSEIFTVTDPTLLVNITASVAVGDIDQDGRPEILACDSTGARLIAFEHDGTFKWRSASLETIDFGASALADLDGDGASEIVVGRQVLKNDGSILWTGAGGRGSQSIYIAPLSLVADVNMDGSPEVLAGNTVYTASGGILWQAPVPDGYNAIADFDDDPFPEIVLVSAGTVRLLEHDGTVKWGPVSIPGGGAGGPPTVADYDGDNEVEIGVAGAIRYAVFETDGTLKWAAVTQDLSSNRTGSSVFDFEGDGSAEVVYSDELTLRIYSGSDGAVLFEMPLSSCTGHEYPLVADVDADGDAEIVAVANDNCGFGPQRGVFVIGDVSGNWVATRKIWNQHTYHITNVTENGAIPALEENNWERFNNYRQNLQTQGSPLAAPDLTASFLRLDTSSCPNAVEIIARIGNGGSHVAAAPVSVAFYDGDPMSGGMSLGVVQTTQDLSPGQYEDVRFMVSPAPDCFLTICAVADDNGSGTGAINECNETNNQCCADIMAFCNQPLGETIKLPANYEFVIEQNTQKEFQVQLFNTGADSQSATVEVINPYSEIAVSLTQQEPITIAPGDVQDIALVVNAGETVGVYDNVLLKVTVENNAVFYSNINIKVVAESMPDLRINSQDIQLIDYTLGESLNLGVLVHNDGLVAASNVQVRFYEFDNLLGETVLADVLAGGARNASITAPITTPGEHLIQVVVDYADVIEEYDEDNNKASQIIKLGDPVPVSGTILVTGSLPSTVYTNGLFTVSGRAVYDIYINGVRYTNYVVQGGSVQITIRDNADNEWVYGGIHTDINGYFSKTLQAPAITGDYQLSMTVTDETFTGERELTFSVEEPPLLPVSQFPVPSYGEGTWVFVPDDGTWIWVWSELPVSAPILESDLRIFSENIHFSEFNSEEGNDITIMAKINYWATSTALVALNVPINFYVTYPGTPKMKIGETIIDSLSVGPPDFGSRYVYTSWRNLNEGIYIVEVEIDPSYVESNMLNNAATRAIIVGDLPCVCGAISGQVTDPWGGVGNIVIELYDSSGTTLLDTRHTDLKGYYLFENIPIGDYHVHIVKPDNLQPDAETKLVNLIEQSIVEVDFHLIKQLEVEIDIKPGSELNSINLSSAGIIPVAILSSENFDATTVDPDTVTLASAAVKIIGQGDRALVREDNVNEDELVDLVCYVITAEFMIETGESIAELEASTFDGTLIHGEDNVVIVPDS